MRRSRWPCAKDLWVVDVAAGCSFGCLFCPVRWRRVQDGEIEVFVDLPDRLRRELTMRRRSAEQVGPGKVLLNAATDSFQPIPSLLAVVHETLEVLFSAGVQVAVRTRGLVPEGFAGLLRRHSDLLLVEQTFFSVDERLTEQYEPGAPHPQQRLESIRRLRAWGVEVRARIQPLIPFVSDTVGHLEELVRHIRSAGIERATSSYLVMRPQVQERLETRIPQAHWNLIRGSFKGQPWRKVGIHQMTRLMPIRTRDQGYRRLRTVAERAGLTIGICACQDPDLGSDCFARQSSTDLVGQLDLFPSAS
ncbi:MAG: hypothetical protein JXR96_29195 [Deltaproteobacteria bacterium]|nr:hypothetical protein [Deltaproteobacteria bacterium]